MKTQQKSNETIEDMMNQDANFIKTQEGYPMFFRDLNDSSNVKFTHYSQSIGLLDFYESLALLPMIHSALTITRNELLSLHKPANALESIALNIAFLEKAYVQFKKSVAY